MVEFQFDQVGVAVVTTFIILITLCVYQCLGRKTTLSRLIQTINKTTVSKKIQTINMKEVVGTQTSQVTTSCAQTKTMKFTERLTNFGDKVVDSADKFYKSCETCEAVIGNEAVGFCKMCEKFMCINCCKHHEKIPLSKNHVFLGNEEMKTARKQKKLFEKCFVPLQNYCICCTSEKCKPKPQAACRLDHNSKPLCLARNIPGTAQFLGCFIQILRQLTFRVENQSFGIKENKTIDRSFSAVVAGFCLYKSETLCFTSPNENTIYKFIYSDNNIYNRNCFISGKINTSSQCYGIATFNNDLAISIYIPTNFSLPEWQVQFISFNGALRRQICFDNDGEPLFKEPKHLTSNDAQDILFVSDQGNHSIIALDTKGYTLFKYTHETIKNPLGLTCDDEGNIYVASEDKVVQIDQNGTKSRVVLSSKETENVKLIDVCYNKLTNELGVLSQSADVTILKPLP